MNLQKTKQKNHPHLFNWFYFLFVTLVKINKLHLRKKVYHLIKLNKKKLQIPFELTNLNGLYREYDCTLLRQNAKSITEINDA